MPTFAGPFEPQIEPTRRLLAVLWRAEAELTHAYGCRACRVGTFGMLQATYERNTSFAELERRGLDPLDLSTVARLARRAAMDNPNIHDFVLPKTTKGTAAMRSNIGLDQLTDDQLVEWLGRYRKDLRYDGETPPYGHAATKWARALCAEIVVILAKRKPPCHSGDTAASRTDTQEFSNS